MGLLTQGSWAVTRSRRWVYPMAAHMGEARAGVLAALDIVSSGGHPGRQLLLGDNLGVMLALERRRAHAYPFLVQVGRFAALGLMFGVQIACRWVPSEMNAADEPSRVYEHPPSADGSLSPPLHSFICPPRGGGLLACPPANRRGHRG